MSTTLLSSQTLRRAALVFAPADLEAAQRLLVEECGNNLPFCETKDAHQLERLRFAAMKLSGGRLEGLRQAVALAKTDWRDLLMAAGFGQDLHAHERWLADADECQ